MRTFDYHKPNSIPEAVALLSNGAESQPIAGGMSLLPAMKLRLTMPGALIDLSGIPVLKGISATTDTLTIGAMTRHVDAADFADGGEVHSGACPARPLDRRPGRAQSRHNRRLARQRQSGRR